jgi:glycine/serine hydroxymethyltransferase
MPLVADWIDQVITRIDDAATIARVADEVRAFCHDYPVPGAEGDGA